MKRIITFYLTREIIAPFFVTLLVFTFILLMVKIMDLTELVVVRGVEPGTVFNLLVYSLPFFLSLTIPMSTLLAVLLAFLRLSGDNEITVLKSAGVSLCQLLPPVIFFSAWAALLTGYLTVDLTPRANTAFRNELLELARVRADIGIKEGVFNDSFKDVTLYVNHIPPDSDSLEDIFIQDGREPGAANIIVAHRGMIASDPKRRALVFQLFDGVIDHIYEEEGSADTIEFQRYEMKLDLEDEGESARLVQRDQYELPTDKLWARTRELFEEGHPHYPAYLMEAHKRLALPIACFILGLAAVPLGLQLHGRGRNWGLSMGLFVFLVYYIILSAGWSLGKSGDFPPALAMWTPNLVIGAVGLYLLRQAAREVPFRPFFFGWFNKS
ncbi:MAG: LPS export ABC transporter permease LptF [Pseudomonadota bacterium]